MIQTHKPSSKYPPYIPFNGIDRYYNVPETDDPDGPYFPMCMVMALALREPLQPDQLVRGLHLVEAKYPQFRLAYTLDYKANGWRRVSDEQLDQHFESMARCDADGELIDLYTQAIPTNNTPLSLPITFTIHNHHLVVKIHHSFGDGRFAVRLIPYVLLAALDQPAFAALPDLPRNFNLPLWKGVWRKPSVGLRMLVNCVRGLWSSYKDFTAKPDWDMSGVELQPIRSGSPMRAIQQIVPLETVTALEQIRKQIGGTVKISLNTLLQVALAHRLMQLGLQRNPPTYTIPIDLGRYFDADTFYAGNLASQIRHRATKRSEPDFVADCLELQTRLDHDIPRQLPLAMLPLEWLLASGGAARYQKVNRDWLLDGQKTDPRLFVLSNVGRLTDFERVLPYFDPESGMPMGAPLMGGPPLAVVVAFLSGKLIITAAYDPNRLTAEQVETAMQAFDPAWITSEGL